MLFRSILFVNPWIYDFTAFDLWAKPIGLINLYTWIKEQGVNSELIDFLYQYYPEIEKKKIDALYKKDDGRAKYYKKKIKLPDSYKGFYLPRNYYRYGLDKQTILKRLVNKKPKLIFVTSLMTYWYKGVKSTVEFLRNRYPDVPIVLGGIYSKLLRKHAKKEIKPDYIINRNIYKNVKKLVKKYIGINLEIPKNNLEIESDYSCYPNLNYIPIRLSKGCPYNCPYCGSNFLDPDYKKAELKSVKKYFLKYYKKGIKNFAFYDDALLINKDRLLKPFLRWIIEKKYEVNFHVPNAMHISLFDSEVAELMKNTNFKTIRFGFETAIRKKFVENKTSKKEFERVVNIIEDQKMNKKNIRIYLIAGMPQQTFDDVEESIRFVQSNHIVPIPNEYSPVPKTSMFKEAVNFSKFDIKNEPLYHNKTIVPCRWEKLSFKDIQRLKQMAREYVYKK